MHQNDGNTKETTSGKDKSEDNLDTESVRNNLNYIHVLKKVLLSQFQIFIYKLVNL
jgi:hypothetical protein